MPAVLVAVVVLGQDPVGFSDEDIRAHESPVGQDRRRAGTRGTWAEDDAVAEDEYSKPEDFARAAAPSPPFLQPPCDAAACHAARVDRADAPSREIGPVAVDLILGLFFAAVDFVARRLGFKKRTAEPQPTDDDID